MADLLQNSNSTCAKTLDENQRCALVCLDNFRSVGYFTCSLGTFVGQSECKPKILGSSVIVSTKIAASMYVELELGRQIPHEVAARILKQGVADALGLKLQDIVKFKVVEVASSEGARKLQGSAKQYEVSYEVLPPHSMNATAVLQKAKAILVENGTARQAEESIAFQQAVSGHEDVVQVLTARQTVEARMFEDAVFVTPQGPREPLHVLEEQDEGITLLPLWIALGVVVGVLFLCTLLCLRGRTIGGPWCNQNPGKADDAWDLEAHVSPDDVVIRVPSHTLLDQPPGSGIGDGRSLGLQSSSEKKLSLRPPQPEFAEGFDKLDQWVVPIDMTPLTKFSI